MCWKKQNKILLLHISSMKRIYSWCVALRIRPNIKNKQTFTEYSHNVIVT